jgi:hypothetical protein
MRWNNNISGFVLRRMAYLLSDGTRSDKIFKDKDVNHVVKCPKDYSGDTVSPTQVYNHLRKWRQKWARITKLKDLSGALWDSDVNAIMLDGEHYLGHCKAEHFSLPYLPFMSFLPMMVLYPHLQDHPKDAEFLNCPIRFYTEMEAIFGHSQATGRFALSSGEALRVNQATSQPAKVEGTDEKSPTRLCEGNMATEILPQSATVGSKRKRGALMMMMFSCSPTWQMLLGMLLVH